MVVELNKDNFAEEVEKSETPVIIDFFADWCGPCQMMGPVFESVSKEYQGKLKFAKVNTETNSELAGQFGVQSIPTLVVIQDGKEIGRTMGYLDAEALKMKIQEFMSQGLNDIYLLEEVK